MITVLNTYIVIHFVLVDFLMSVSQAIHLSEMTLQKPAVPRENWKIPREFMGHNQAGWILPHLPNRNYPLQDRLILNTKALSLHTVSETGAEISVGQSFCRHLTVVSPAGMLWHSWAVNIKVHNRALKAWDFSRNPNLSSVLTLTTYMNLVKLLNFSMP